MENTTRPKTGGALREFAHADVSTLATLLPDTPWTTRPVQCCERRIARAWVDDEQSPSKVAVLVPGDPDSGRATTAYLFGSNAPPDPLIEWAGAQDMPLDVVCDDDVGLHLYEAHPDAQVTDIAARWFEHLDTVERPENGVRRLRLRDEEAVAALGASDVLGAFETLKDLLMVGGAAAVFDGDRIASAAFTVDQSVNYARIAAFTTPDHRGQGLASAACRHLIAHHHDQGRLACALVETDDAVAEALARSIGFESAARVRRYRLTAAAAIDEPVAEPVA